jgi:alkanesulfonate monooxygenase SsuD/methylene tetrahydromethanopterin reductase-like flavin-dependent oxidoreductase (luciferase family)
MRFGLQIPNFTYPGVRDEELFERVAAIAVTAEESGFDSVWVMDHLIAATDAEAERAGRAMAAARGMDDERYRSVIVGSPDSVVEQVGAFLAAGLDGLVFNLPDAHDLEPVRLAGETLVRAAL